MAKYVEFVGSERIKRGDDTLKCVVQSHLILCETSSTEIHVNDTDGSCTHPSEASLERVKDKCGRHASLRMEKEG